MKTIPLTLVFIAGAWPAMLNAALEPMEVTDGLVAHFDASRGLSTIEGTPPEIGERVERWTDQASIEQGDNAAQGERRGPFLLGSVPELNGRPALDFRNGELLISGLSMNVDEGTWFVVFRSPFVEEDGLIALSDHCSSEVHPDDNGSLVARGWRTTGGSYPIDAVIRNLRVRSSEFFIQNITRKRNGTITQRLTDRTGRVLSSRATLANDSRTRDSLYIGGTGIGSSNRVSNALTGQIAEILVFDRPVTTAERNEVETYLFEKYFGAADTDLDYLPDEWEQEYLMSLDATGEGDLDGDLLVNRREFEAGTDPTRRDTDGDGLDDAREVAMGSSPLEADTDGDLFSDALEALAGTGATSSASKPAALYAELRVFSDMESAESDRHRIRNLAGSGSAGWTRSVPGLQVAGISGKGVQFSGTSNGGGLNYGPQDDFEATGGTVSLAFRLDRTTGQQFLACRGNRDFTRPGWSIFTEEEKLVVRVTSSNRRHSLRLSHPGPLVPDAWNTVAVTFGPGGTITPYLNGSSEGWVPDSPSPGLPDFGLNRNSPLLVGTDDNERHPFAGILDEFAVWDRVLAATEISGVHQNALAGLGLDGQTRNGSPILDQDSDTSLVFCGQSFALRAAGSVGTTTWKKNGGAVPGATATDYIVEPSLADDLGRFQALRHTPDGLQPGPETLVRVAPFDFQQVLRTLGGASDSGEFVAEQLAVDGDTLVAGVSSYRTGLGATRGQVRILNRHRTDPDRWEHAQTIPSPHNNANNFGMDIALEGNTMVIAADRDYSGGDKWGRVFVYTRNSPRGRWNMRQEIPSPARVDNDHFGRGLDIEGDTMVVGALGATQAFVFKRRGTRWSLEKTLEPPKFDLRTTSYGNFVAIQGDTIVVTEYRSSDEDDDGAGVVHIYRRNEGGTNQWGRVQRLTAPGIGTTELFGLGVALEGDTLAINSGDRRRIELYHLDPDTGLATWEATLAKPRVTGVSEPQFSLYGRQIELSGNYLLTSDGWDRERGLESGAAYLFRRDPGRRDKWTLMKKILGEGIGSESKFGGAITMQDNEIFASGADDITVDYPIGAVFGFRCMQDVLPAFSSAPVSLADTGEPYRYDIGVTAAVGTEPIVSVTGELPDWLTLETLEGGRALLSGTPPPAAEGAWPIRLSVGAQWSLPSSQEFTLHVQPGNLAPVVRLDRLELTGAEDEPLEASLARLFADGEDPIEDLEFELLSTVPDPLVTAVSMPTGEARLQVHLGEHENGTGEFSVRALDRGGMHSMGAVQVTISPVNDPPTASPLADIISDPAALPISKDLSASFDDPDLAREGDQLRYLLLNLTAPDLVSSASIDPTSGLLNLEIAPYHDGEASMEIQVTDKDGVRASETLRVVVPPIAPPAVALASQLQINPQTGLLEQTITATNTGSRPIGGFELGYSNLPAGVKVHNATSQGEGSYRLEIGNPLAVGASVALVVEFYDPNRDGALSPEPTVTSILPISPKTAAVQESIATRLLRNEDGSILLEFPAVPGRHYELQYSEDGRVWKISPVSIMAAGTRVQLIDNGPPRTDAHPSTKAMRLYRVVAQAPSS